MKRGQVFIRGYERGPDGSFNWDAFDLSTEEFTEFGFRVLGKLAEIFKEQFPAEDCDAARSEFLDFLSECGLIVSLTELLEESPAEEAPAEGA